MEMPYRNDVLGMVCNFWYVDLFTNILNVRTSLVDKQKMKRSKKGKPMSYCTKCKKDTVDVEKMGGIVCAQCYIIKWKRTKKW